MSLFGCPKKEKGSLLERRPGSVRERADDGRRLRCTSRQAPDMNGPTVFALLQSTLGTRLAKWMGGGIGRDGPGSPFGDTRNIRRSMRLSSHAFAFGW
jgi:hypothetical protein